MHEGGGTCLKYLKRDGTERRRVETNILKTGGKLGHGVGALKKGGGGGGLEPPYELCNLYWTKVNTLTTYIKKKFLN